ncbi:hypothetical protein PAP_04975 [Palaeococcus pacificus DY20341]|uniref:Uncharacterized protein n=1 Tax=Palaeococcus pacificus DY20341 TaxID=1343739 RepID=A0A075LTF1_9EURY|nr:hypothetical protein [Palaeococcus pacificus]AIF69406.1 hypothetical protein PAP_04975 [Palaeococcus pacificus DY20341]
MEGTTQEENYKKVLGEYVDKLATGTYVGTARGLLYFIHNGFKYPMISSRIPPLIDIFLDGSTLEFMSFWSKDRRNMYALCKFAISKIKIFRERSDYILLSIEPHGKLKNIEGKFLLLLYTNKELKDTIKLILESEELKNGEEEGFAYSTLFSF